MTRALSFAPRHAQSAQLPLPDVLLLRALRLGRCLSRASSGSPAAWRSSRRCSGCTSPIRPASTRPGARSAWSRARRPSRRVPARRGARRIAARRIAAAIFLAVAPLHVRDSHYIKHDVPATLAIVARVSGDRRASGRARATRGPRTRDTLVAGAACGVAFSTHYYCVFLAVPLTLAIVQAWRARGLRACARQLVIGAAASAVVFFALSPFILVEPTTAHGATSPPTGKSSSIGRSRPARSRRRCATWRCSGAMRAAPHGAAGRCRCGLDADRGAGAGAVAARVSRCRS